MSSKFPILGMLWMHQTISYYEILVQSACSWSTSIGCSISYADPSSSCQRSRSACSSNNESWCWCISLPGYGPELDLLVYLWLWLQALTVLTWSGPWSSLLPMSTGSVSTAHGGVRNPLPAPLPWFSLLPWDLPKTNSHLVSPTDPYTSISSCTSTLKIAQVHSVLQPSYFLNPCFLHLMKSETSSLIYSQML